METVRRQVNTEAEGLNVSSSYMDFYLEYEDWKALDDKYQGIQVSGTEDAFTFKVKGKTRALTEKEEEECRQALHNLFSAAYLFADDVFDQLLHKRNVEKEDYRFLKYKYNKNIGKMGDLYCSLISGGEKAFFQMLDQAMENVLSGYLVMEAVPSIQNGKIVWVGPNGSLYAGGERWIDRDGKEVDQKIAFSWRSVVRKVFKKEESLC